MDNSCDERHNSLVKNSTTATQRRITPDGNQWQLMEQEVDYWHNGQLVDGQLAQLTARLMAQWQWTAQWQRNGLGNQQVAGWRSWQ